MSSSTAINFKSIEAQVHAEAERKVTVLRQIVDTHTTLARARDEFLAADAERVRQLTALITEAKGFGFDTKTLRPFDPAPLGQSKTTTRRRPAARSASGPRAGATAPLNEKNPADGSGAADQEQ